MIAPAHRFRTMHVPAPTPTRLLLRFVLGLSFAGIALPCLSCAETARSPEVVAPVWAGHPVGFAFKAHEGNLFIAFYDAERQLTVAQRPIDGGQWRLARPPGVWNEARKRGSNAVGWDSHNSIVIAFDRDGYIHLSGNMHADPLVYYRSARPLDITSLERLDRMTGDREARCTYPVFFQDAAGELYFRYRDGSSGNGSDIFNRYDTKTKTWTHLLDTPLHDGQGARNAYALDPIAGPDGRFHVVWMWRNTPDAATNHTLSYVRSADLRHWEDAHGRAVALPITLGKGDIVDDAKPGGGLVNTTFALGFDRDKKPVIVYHRYDAEGNSQLFAARPTETGWEKKPITDWKFRWAFGGMGTLQTDVYIRAPKADSDGSLVVPVFLRDGGASRLRFDPVRLIPVGALPSEPGVLPPELMKPADGYVVHTAVATAAKKKYVLRWETLPSNRDRPRDFIPPPSELRLFEF